MSLTSFFYNECGSKSGLAKFTRLALMLAMLPSLLMTTGHASELLDYPNVQVTYYTVSGKTTSAIRSSINHFRPVDPDDGKRYDGLTLWRIEWQWNGAANGGCDLANATVRAIITVSLPKLDDKVPAQKAALNKWNAYITALKGHEANHARFALNGVAQVKRAIAKSSCDTANAAAKLILEDIRSESADYDRKTDHGAKEGAVFP